MSSPSDWRNWVPETVVATVVLALGLTEALSSDYYNFASNRPTMVWVAVMTAVAVGLSRRLPGLALLVVWLVCGYEVVSSAPVMFVQVTLAAVAFGTARWGRTTTVVLSAVSIPVAGILAVLYSTSDTYGAVVSSRQYRTLIDALQQFGTTWQITGALFGMALLGVPWLAGLTLRFQARAATSLASQQAAEEETARAHRESEQAREIARLREEQNQLARDVHDVVGHSLAVILAQAESAQFLDEADTGALRLSMANIANSARSSLQDVRQVLTSGTDPASGPGELHDLVEGVRASGHAIEFDEVGTARPLAPELATVAYRVLQEMLTNAIRHGRRHGTVHVELHWAGELRIEVVNETGPEPVGAEGGHGLEGMHRRLESVGGRLDVRRRGDGEEETFTATAWVPMRTVYP